MSPISPEEFKALMPHFSKMDEDHVGFYLDFAASCVNEGVFGDDYRFAVALKAAHLLSISPKGQKARLESEDAKTTYGAMFEELLHAKTAGPRIAP